MIRFYRAPFSTNCERVALALAHKGLEPESVVIDYSDRSAVVAVSGQGLVPVIEEDGTVVHDSRAILAYLEQRHPEPRLYPDHPARRAEVEVFGEWFEAVYKAAPNRIEAELETNEPDAALIARLSAEMRARLTVFENLLADRDYLFGEFGFADCVAFPFLKYAARRDPDDDEPFHRILEEHQPLGGSHPGLRAWIARVDGRPRAY